MTSRIPWQWGPKTLRLLASIGISWRVVEDIPREDMGTAPGDVYWDGQVLVIEKTCPREWVVHEVAHYLVCQRDSPQFLKLRNWGTEQTGEEVSLAEDLESQACVVNVALLIRMNLPWRNCADGLNLIEEYWKGPRGCYGMSYRKRFQGQEWWNSLREELLGGAEPYLKWGGSHL
jgi:hypothetical protein